MEKLLFITPVGLAPRIGGGNYLLVRKAGEALLIRPMPDQPR